MRNTLLLLGLLISLVWLLTNSSTAAPLAGPTVRVSVRSNGNEANNDSHAPDISADGRAITFASDATNLVSGDNNNARDIFVHDLVTGQTERVSLKTGGAEANGDSFAPAISDDGRIIVFYSLASNLVNGDTNGMPDIFAHDRDTNETTLISKVLNGTANGPSFDPDVSADGRYVVFSSSASNLIGGDNNFDDDIFRWDRQSEVMLRISIDSNEVEANGDSHHPAISGNGQRILFVSSASNLVTGDGNNTADIFLRDVTAGTTTRVNVSSGGAEANGGSWLADWDPDISQNGRYAVFISFANNLVSGDSNGYPDVFLRDLNMNTTIRVSVATSGVLTDDWSEQPTVSADGRYVAFRSDATTLVNNDLPGPRDVFVRDRQTHTTVLASMSTEGNAGNQSSQGPVIAADGRFVAFASSATNLVPGDNNNDQDIFVHDMQDPPPPPTLSVNYTSGAPGSEFSFIGQNFTANETAAVWINGVKLGDISSDGDGNISFEVLTTAGSQEGWYFATVIQNELQATAGFHLDQDVPLRTGTGTGFALPDGIAYTEVQYLPLVFKDS